MKIAQLFLIFSVFAHLAGPNATAQTPAPTEAGPNDKEIREKIWNATLPGGSYTVGLSNIASVSLHEYVSNGTTRVYEVTISATGPVVARFYYLEAIADKSPSNVGSVLIERAKTITDEASKRTGSEDLFKKVVKDYPVATHAHTVEYRLGSLESLKALHNSARAAWLKNQGRSFTDN